MTTLGSQPMLPVSVNAWVHASVDGSQAGPHQWIFRRRGNRSEYQCVICSVVYTKEALKAATD